MKSLFIFNVLTSFFPQFQFYPSNQNFLVCLFLAFWRVFLAHQLGIFKFFFTCNNKCTKFHHFAVQNSAFKFEIRVDHHCEYAASWCSSIYFASIAVERETVWKLEPPRNDFISAAPTLTSDNLEGQKKGSLAWNDTITTSVWPSVSVREQSEREREKSGNQAIIEHVTLPPPSCGLFFYLSTHSPAVWRLFYAIIKGYYF